LLTGLVLLIAAACTSSPSGPVTTRSSRVSYRLRAATPDGGASTQVLVHDDGYSILLGRDGTP
jgi:hypothetical protein